MTHTTAPDAEAALHRFTPAAQALHATDVLPMRVDPVLAHGNVQTGVAAALPLQASLAAALPVINWVALADLPALAQAVVVAAARVDRDAAGTGEIARLRAQATPLRDLLLTTAEALAHKGLVPQAEVTDIRRGRGAIDHATDCVRLAGLFRDHADKLAGRHAVEKSEVDEASRVGSRLLEMLRPAGFKPGHAPETEADRAADLRDRLWTLLVRGYGDVRRVAFWQWLDAADEHVPPLGAHRRVARPIMQSEPAPG